MTHWNHRSFPPWPRIQNAPSWRTFGRVPWAIGTPRVPRERASRSGRVARQRKNGTSPGTADSANTILNRYPLVNSHGYGKLPDLRGKSFVSMVHWKNSKLSNCPRETYYKLLIIEGFSDPGYHASPGKLEHRFAIFAFSVHIRGV